MEAACISSDSDYFLEIWLEKWHDTTPQLGKLIAIALAAEDIMADL
jgi:hypothetical protein